MPRRPRGGRRASPARSEERAAGAEGTPAERARALALRVLAFHARTEAQLRARLDRSGLGEEADGVLAWLRRLGYVDDAAWARARARALVASRWGPRRAEQRLVIAGVSPAAARAAVAEALAEAAGEEARGGAELAQCRAALRARLRGSDPASLDDRGRARLARFLLGRGFSGAVVARAVGLRDDVDA